jgi:hypothetical protein
MEPVEAAQGVTGEREIHMREVLLIPGAQEVDVHLGVFVERRDDGQRITHTAGRMGRVVIIAVEILQGDPFVDERAAKTAALADIGQQSLTRGVHIDVPDRGAVQGFVERQRIECVQRTDTPTEHQFIASYFAQAVHAEPAGVPGTDQIAHPRHHEVERIGRPGYRHLGQPIPEAMDLIFLSCLRRANSKQG